jgi:hypothetical protein
MGYKQYSAYGSKILATLSQRLTARYGKGYTYTAVTKESEVIDYFGKSMICLLLAAPKWLFA